MPKDTRLEATNDYQMVESNWLGEWLYKGELRQDRNGKCREALEFYIIAHQITSKAVRR